MSRELSACVCILGRGVETSKSAGRSKEDGIGERLHLCLWPCPVLDSSAEVHLEKSPCDANAHAHICPHAKQQDTHTHSETHINNRPSRLHVLKVISEVRVAGVCSALRTVSRPSWTDPRFTNERPEQMRSSESLWKRTNNLSTEEKYEELMKDLLTLCPVFSQLAGLFSHSTVLSVGKGVGDKCNEGVGRKGTWVVFAQSDSVGWGLIKAFVDYWLEQICEEQGPMCESMFEVREALAWLTEVSQSCSALVSTCSFHCNV